jgi:hypothetical protein
MLQLHRRMLKTGLPLLAMALCPIARAQVAICSNSTLRGDFAVVISGQTGVPTNPVPRSGVAMTRFDGQGNVTDLDHIVGDGAQPPTDWRSGTGTYTVNTDCTGKFQVNFDGAPPLILYFVVGKAGNAFRGVVGAPGANVTADGIKLESLF